MWYYNELIKDIEDRIQVKDMNNEALSPLFLLGYSSQVKDLYTNKEQKEENIDDNNSEQN
ncbi:hypothetical protein D3C76_1800980 [compost metagenome]